MRRRAGRDESRALGFSAGSVRYLRGGREIWSFPIGELRLVAESTNEDGPFGDDWFFAFATGPRRWFEAPVSAASEHLREDLTRELGVSWSLSLVGSTTFASCVLWPPELAGRPLYTYVPDAIYLDTLHITRVEPLPQEPPPA